MTIYILQSVYKGIPEPPKVFDNEKRAQKIKEKMVNSSPEKEYQVEIYEIELSLKMKSFVLV